MKIKLTFISTFSAAVLTACAGGGQAEPKVPVAIPTAQPIQNVSLTADSANVISINTNPTRSDTLKEGLVDRLDSWGDTVKREEIIYRTPSGNYYSFSTFSDPMVPTYSSPSFELRTKHSGQPLSEGGKLFACCSSSAQSTYVPATKQDYLKFGAWIGSNGEVDLFVGGKPVGTVKGAYAEQNIAKGKTTYQVWAVRVRNGEFVTSTYDPGKPVLGSSEKSAPKLSLLTANFNTNKLGGTIVGNSDFGADVVMKDVDINGVDFAGTAESDGKNGNVEGKFFGKFNSSYAQEVSIGGKVTFDADKSLDTVFGGVKHAADRNTADTTLTPVGN